MVNGEKRQIFVVEDDEAVRGSTRALLEAQGFGVREFANAEAFLDATAERCDADCIVLDHNLAGLSGLDLVLILRAKGVTTPAIMICGNSGPLHDRAAKAGIRAVLRKPLAADGLLAWLAEIFPEKQ